MEYAPIAYSDLLLANGVYLLNPKLPSVIGGEGAGIVEAIGPGVTSVNVGDRVTIPFGAFTWSEKVLAPVQGLFVVPPSIDGRTASMLNINPTTAVLLLDEFLTTGKTVSTRRKRLRGIQSALPRAYRRTRLKAIQLWMA
jgi:NADPH:quinone reductase-like Zn-dependent oxidoreductase